MTLIKAGDGVAAGRQFTENYIADMQMRDRVIQDLRAERDTLVSDNNLYRSKAGAAEEALRQVSLIAPTILDALAVKRAAIQAVAPNGGWTIEQIKAVELAARIVRQLEEEYR